MATREQKLWQHVLENKQRRDAPKQPKNVPKPTRVRQKGWASEALEDPEVFYDHNLPDHEPIMPRGEAARRSRTRSIEVVQAGTNGHEGGQATGGNSTSAEPSAGAKATTSSKVRGVVVEVSTGVCEVTAEDRKLLCTPRAALRAVDTGFTNLVAVGDEVLVSVIGADRGIVEAVLPRRSALARPDVFYPHLQQVIVANVDQLLIVASWREPAFWPELVDRYLIGAERNRLAPIICVNKVDLASIREEPQRALASYEQLGYRVLFTSAVNGTGLRELKHLLHRRTTALAGLSGVGKSSILAAVEPGLHLRIEKVSDRHHEGRHTTTQVSLHPLKEGGYVVDTPGIREFGLSGLIQRDLAQFYPEIAALAAGCRFPDCTHTREPDCAVRLAEREGRLSRMRLDNYGKILRTLPA